MEEFKERPKMGKPKNKSPAMLAPKQADRQMKEKYLQQLDQRPDGPDGDSEYATEQVEGTGRWATDALTGASHRLSPRQRGAIFRERPGPTPEQTTPYDKI